MNYLIYSPNIKDSRVINTFKYSASSLNKLDNNPQHRFAMNHSMMIYQKNTLYSFIPKNACSTMRLSIAYANGCIDSVEQGHWIHNNNPVSYTHLTLPTILLV